ncbi:prepilin peptidase [Paenibacillus mesophilus]|uniref:prepilin peptidase n=1 Tax=Paenibacillus mesophilus TaxID=2582849 RepID=UPI00110EE20F|nr:A24 family peptidase [Paenibacillus mesophilus]TMV52642.1 prepilin peptidase [Paenibacillus mesophilus]
MTDLTLLTAFTAAFFGLIIGSFLNVVAIRLLKGESISYPPSHCVNCQHRLYPIDLIPVFSYLLLMGKCRYCRERISAAYPIGELAAAVTFGVTAWKIGYQPELLAGLLLASILIVIVQTDLRAMIIPDKVVFFGFGAAVLIRLFVHPLPLWSYLAAFVVGGGILLLLAVVSKGGMGGGDIKLFAFIGLILGLPLTLLALFVSALLGTLYGLILIVFRKFKRRTAIPFGPFLALGSLLSYLWGTGLIDFYVRLFVS